MPGDAGDQEARSNTDPEQTDGTFSAVAKWLRDRVRRAFVAPHDEPEVLLGETDSDEAHAAAVQAALSHVLSRPDSIRQRAQNAATISSAVAAALVIAGVGQLTRGSEPYRWWTIALIFLALVAWVVSVGLFVYAVAFIDKDLETGTKPGETGSTPGETGSTPGETGSAPGDFQALVNRYQSYADKVRAGTRVAAVASGCAMILTVLAICFEVTEQLVSSPTRTTVVLTPEGAIVVDRLCRSSNDAQRTDHIVAMVHRTELTKPVVQMSDVELATKTVGAKRRPCTGSRATLRLPRSTIRATKAERR